MGPDFDRPPAWRRYLRFWRTDPTSDVDDELRFHLEARAEELVAQGMDPDEALRAARTRFGDVRAIRETCRSLVEQRERSVQRSQWLAAFGDDLRFASRQLRKAPGFTLIAILTMALGVGANTAIFSLVDAVLLRPLPFAAADRVVVLSERWQGGNQLVSVGNFVDWHEQSGSFEAMGASTGESFNLTGEGAPERLFGARVTAGFFRAVHIAPVLGRYFLEEEDHPGGPRVAVLGHALWMARFAGDRAILGREITLNGTGHTVVGIAPPEYSLSGDAPQLWVPAAFTEEQKGPAARDQHYLFVVGLLRPGVTATAAQLEVSEIERQILRRYSGIGADSSVAVRPMATVLVRDHRTQLLVLQASVTLVLLIACANVANLLIARGAARGTEMAIRSALGAGRRRLVRQLLTESVLLALLGGGAGLLVAHFGVRMVVALNVSDVPRLAQAGLDVRVLAFTLVTTLACGVVAGFAPAVRASRRDPQSALREAGREAVASARDRLRSLLVVAEIAIALVLLTGAGLLIRSALLVNQVNPGFEVRDLLSFRVSLPAERYPDAAAAERAFNRIEQAVRDVPGVTAAAVVSTTPFTGVSTNGLDLPDRDAPAAMGTATFRMASPRYFQTMRIPLRRGRLFSAQDLATSPRVVVINETLARIAFPGEDPIGKRIGCCEGGADDAVRWKEVVGVVGDLRAWGLGRDVEPEFYLPVAQAPAGGWDWVKRTLTVVVRAPASPARMVESLQRAVATVDATLPVYEMRTLEGLMERSTASVRFSMVLLTTLGAIGLLLAAVGVYGVISYVVTLRTREIGIRMALGATSRAVQSMVVRHGMTLALAGGVLGLAIGLVTTRVLSALLYRVTPRDPITFAAVGLVLGTVAVLASWAPARRATHIDPVRAMRV